MQHSGKNDFDMSKVLPLTRWKDKGLAEREEFSDEEDSENEESDVEDITISCDIKEAEDYF